MGQAFGTNFDMDPDESRVVHRSMEPRYLREDVPNNGLMFNDLYLPDEIIIHILSFVSNRDLIRNCLFVCHKWSELISDEVWKVKAERKSRFPLHLKPYRRLPNLVYQGMCFNIGYNSNLLLNNSGQSLLSEWQIIQSGGNQWKVEAPAVGVPRPETATYEEPKHCFATSFNDCKKRQFINLIRKGVHPKILDDLQPDIIVSEWCAARWDCDSFYKMEVSLLDEHKAVLDKFEEEVLLRNWLDGWHVVSHTFKNYGPGVRYIEFSHTGRDLRYWAGHYGSKMANAQVIIDISARKDAAGDN